MLTLTLVVYHFDVTWDAVPASSVTIEIFQLSLTLGIVSVPVYQFPLTFDVTFMRNPGKQNETANAALRVRECIVAAGQSCAELRQRLGLVNWRSKMTSPMV